MIPLAIMEALPALVKIGGVIVPLISGERKAELRQKWVSIIQRKVGSDDERKEKAQDIRQYLANRLQDAGRTPLYEWAVCIEVPLGLVTDCVDLLIDNQSKRSEQGLFGSLFGAPPKTQRKEWARTVKLTLDDHTPDSQAIIRAFADLIADAGRSAYYYVRSDTLGIDLGMLADMGEAMIG